MKKNPILVTGTSRAGAGLVAGVLNICGAFGGYMSNKRGMFENDRIKETIVKPYLDSIGCDPLGQNPLPKTIKSLPMDWKEEVEKIMVAENYKGGAWMYKDSRSSLLWQVWNHAYPDAKWIIVRRKPGDIVQSCMKTAYMNAYKDEAGWLQWIHEHENKFVEMITEGLNCKVIWPERMLHGDYKQLYDTLEWLELPWKVDVLTYIDPLLYKSRKRKEI